MLCKSPQSRHQLFILFITLLRDLYSVSLAFQSICWFRTLNFIFICIHYDRAIAMRICNKGYISILRIFGEGIGQLGALQMSRCLVSFCPDSKTYFFSENVAHQWWLKNSVGNLRKDSLEEIYKLCRLPWFLLEGGRYRATQADSVRNELDEFRTAPLEQRHLVSQL